MADRPMSPDNPYWLVEPNAGAAFIHVALGESHGTRIQEARLSQDGSSRTLDHGPGLTHDLTAGS